LSDIDRIYKSLFVYSLGFHEMIGEILKNNLKKESIQTNLWKVYLILLENCCKNNYKLVIKKIIEDEHLKFKEL
jgi:hypothetical protein